MRRVLGKLERRALGFILWATTCGAAHGQVVNWSQSMLDELGAIADTATIEHLRCLLAAWRNDTLYIVAAHEPKIIAATALFLSSGPCPALVTAGEWHNHIPRQITMMGENLGSPYPPAAYCDLSLVDRKAERRPAPPLLLMISVNKDVSCLWVFTKLGHYGRVKHWPPTLLPRDSL